MLTKKQIITAIIAILAIIAIIYAARYWTREGVPPDTAASKAKLEEIQNLILNKNCADAIVSASTYLQAHPNAAEIWHLKGVCEHDLGKFAEAKTSFEKALALNPNHAVARTYLERLQPRPGEVILAPAELPLDIGTFESRIGLKFEGVLTLTNVIKRPATIPEYFVAIYSSSRSYSETAAYLKGELEQAKFDFSASETNESLVYATFTPKEQKIFTVRKGSSPTMVTIKYLKYE